MTRIHNIQIKKGSTCRLAINVTDNGNIKDLTGYSARMQVRPTPNSATLSSDFTAYLTINNPLLGQLVLTIPAAITSALAWTKGVYDLEVYSAGDADVICVLQGEISTIPEVTR